MPQKRRQIGNRLRGAQHFHRAHAHGTCRFQINPQIVKKHTSIRVQPSLLQAN